MSGRQYTWVSHGDDPIFEKLDQVLLSTEWEEKFPLCIVLARNKGQSYHTLVPNTGSLLTLPALLFLNLRGVGCWWQISGIAPHMEERALRSGKTRFEWCANAFEVGCNIQRVTIKYRRKKSSLR